MSDPGKSTDAGAASLPALVGRLGEDIVNLLDSKLTLLKIEIREDVNAYGRGMIAVGVGAMVVAVGFALVNTALAFVIAAVLAAAVRSQPLQYALGFTATGSLYLLVGAIIILKTKDRLGRYDLKVEASVEELEKDKQWLRREL